MYDKNKLYYNSRIHNKAKRIACEQSNRRAACNENKIDTSIESAMNEVL